MSPIFPEHPRHPKLFYDRVQLIQFNSLVVLLQMFTLRTYRKYAILLQKNISHKDPLYSPSAYATSEDSTSFLTLFYFQVFEAVLTVLW